MNINGLALNITMGSLEECFNLQKVITDALRGRGIHFSLNGFSFEKDLLDNNFDVGALIEMVLSVPTDKALRDSLLVLAKRCVIGEGAEAVKVDLEFFEREENRQHYFPIMIEIAKVNLLPFFRGLNLESLIPENWKGNNQK